ncbi:DUF4189 domain-containing protein [Xanthomonas hortorum]|uniref:DUF4189 domain-containing protein n=1 Tax=Xanthomonas hortorum TaxID=56454 RepID=UPI0032E8AD97
MARYLHISFLFLFLNVSYVAFGQTACPSGVAPGSPQCGPDSGTSRAEAPPQPTGEWIKTWGAIAASSTTGDIGTTVGKFSEEEAKVAAMGQCALNGAIDCAISLTYRNQCAAVVASTTSSGTVFQGSATVTRAIKIATQACEESYGGPCKVWYSECTKPVFQKY